MAQLQTSEVGKASCYQVRQSKCHFWPTVDLGGKDRPSDTCSFHGVPAVSKDVTVLAPLVGEPQVASQRFSWDTDSVCHSSTEFSCWPRTLPWNGIVCSVGAVPERTMSPFTTNFPDNWGQMLVCSCWSGWPSGCLTEWICSGRARLQTVHPWRCHARGLGYECHLLELCNAGPSAPDSEAGPLEGWGHPIVCARGWREAQVYSNHTCTLMTVPERAVGGLGALRTGSIRLPPIPPFPDC